jgi:hypothetical protein
METNSQKTDHQPLRNKTPVSFQRYKAFLERNGVKNYSERPAQILEDLHRQSLNKHLMARAMACEAAEKRRKQKTESPKARSNSTTTEAEG